MAVSSTSLSFLSTSSTTLTNQLDGFHSKKDCHGPSAFSSPNIITTCSSDATGKNSTRRLLLLGAGTLSLSSLTSTTPLLAQEKPANFEEFVDKADGYSYYYPSDWVEYDYRGHDSCFKDRYLQLQNVRLSFIPTTKSDIHEMGSLEEVVYHLLHHVYPTPTQIPDVMAMQEKSVDGKNYYTFEYILTSPEFARAAYATVAVGNGRYYTLIVGANERRWKRVRNKLKVVADSFKLLDI